MDMQIAETVAWDTDLRSLNDAEIDLVNGGSFWGDVGHFLAGVAFAIGSMALGMMLAGRFIDRTV